MNKKLYSEMVSLISGYNSRCGMADCFEAVCYFVGFYGCVDSEKLDLIRKLYADGFLKV